MGLCALACTGRERTPELDDSPRETSPSTVDVPVEAAPASTDARADSPSGDLPDTEALAAARRRSDLSFDEEVRLFPAWLAAERDPQADPGPAWRWRGTVEGWIFEPEEDGKLRQSLVAQLRVAAGGEEMTLQSDIAVERIRPFLVDNERGEELDLMLGSALARTTASTAGGRFGAELVVHDGPTRGAPVRREVRLVTRPDDARRFVGSVFLLPPSGVLVVSDIDDTIKHSDVRDKVALLRTTFLEPHRFVGGMASRYRGWTEAGAHLHFVSASPWQLYAGLRAAMDEAGFPAASYALRSLRVDTVDLIRLLSDDSESVKGPAIEAMLARLPEWRFVLVGDSGEKDPEIYGRIARQFPERVIAVYIRDVSGEARASARYATAFEGVDPAKWSLFRDGSELPETLE